ncbi:MAG: sigma-70 family RNA polymerase sigma factor [Fimbriimonadaceae bacterium]|nr:sigma-70 family RNA polymerase sigma factor [Fimbriimonadaceae bacterium]
MLALTSATPSIQKSHDQRLGMFAKKNSLNFEREVSPELPVLYRVAKRLGCKHEEAEDLVQTCLIKAYKAWDRFDGQHLRSWLIRILRNERLMVIRSQKDVLSLDEHEDLDIPVEGFWTALSGKLDAERILAAIEQLSPNYRLTIHLCDVEEMSYEEAAQIMDIPIGTVRSRLSRARQIVRDTLIAEQSSVEATL